MADMGNDLANTVVKSANQTLESFLQLLKFISERNKNKINDELNKEKLKDIKQQNKDNSFKRKILIKSGEINQKKLLRLSFITGSPLHPITIELSSKRLYEFAQRMENEGILFSSLSKQNTEFQKLEEKIKELESIKINKGKLTKEQLNIKTGYEAKLEEIKNGNKTFVVNILEKDLERTLSVIDRMNKDIIKEKYTGESRDIKDHEDTSEFNNNVNEQVMNNFDISNFRVDNFKEVLEKSLENIDNNVIYMFNTDNKFDKKNYIELSLDNDNGKIKYSIFKDGKIESESLKLSEQMNIEEFANVLQGKSDLRNITAFLNKYDSRNSENFKEDELKEIGPPRSNFDIALNHFTESYKGRKEPFYLVDRKNPSNYIEIKSERDKDYNNREYTKSNYSVYKNSEFIKNFTDERFEGRAKDFWWKTKKEMQNIGDISNNDILICNNKDEMNKYKNYLKEEKEKAFNEKEFNINVDSHIYKDFSGIMGKLKEQLNSLQMDINKDNKVKYIDTQVTLNESNVKDMKTDEKLAACMGITISKQITNYEEMNKIQNEILILKQQYQTTLSNKEDKSISALINDIGIKENQMEIMQRKADRLNEKQEQLINAGIVIKINNEYIEEKNLIWNEEQQSYIENITHGEENIKQITDNKLSNEQWSEIAKTDELINNSEKVMAYTSEKTER